MPFEEGNKEGRKFSSENQPEKNGRPKKLPELDKLLADVLGEDKDGIEAAKAILMALRAKAVKGDVRAAEVLLDRAYGKAQQNFNGKLDVKVEDKSPWFKDEVSTLKQDV